MKLYMAAFTLVSLGLLLMSAMSALPVWVSALVTIASMLARSFGLLLDVMVRVVAVRMVAVRGLAVLVLDLVGRVACLLRVVVRRVLRLVLACRSL